MLPGPCIRVMLNGFRISEARSRLRGERPLTITGRESGWNENWLPGTLALETGA